LEQLKGPNSLHRRLAERAGREGVNLAELNKVWTGWWTRLGASRSRSPRTVATMWWCCRRESFDG
jgi:hypothetical protein